MSSPTSSAAKSSVSPGSLPRTVELRLREELGDRRAQLTALRRHARDRRGPSRPTPSPAPRARRARHARTSCGTRRKRTASAPANTPNSRAAGEPRSRPRARARSARSGLSEPKRRSASAYVSRGNGVSISTPTHSRQIAREHRLHQREEQLLVGERQLDVELGDLLHAVGAEILVPEADRDLVVAVEPGDHASAASGSAGSAAARRSGPCAGGSARRSRARPRASA